ncbi:hypothetical protein [Nocardia sp. NPDC019255]|uniref:hypothetical protein n=1 Tax=Nocardia sp. NPDC019255 TaxID=3154591 RepID=UPI003406569F
MRIRSTKPEFWRSERIADLSWDARFVLKGLESYVDDNGVGKDDVALVVADVFPRDMVREPSRTLARVSEAISELHQKGFVHRYEADGTRLMYLSWWESFQRIDKPTKGRFPRPDGTLNYKDSSIGDSLASPRESSGALAPGTEEQGNRGSEEETCSPALPLNVIAHPTAASRRASGQGEPTGFSDFWAVYPRRQNKGAAVKAFAKAIKKAGLAEIIAGAQRYADDPNRDPAFTAHASTWLNGERWSDDPAPARAAANGASARSQSVRDMTAQLIQQRQQEMNR